MRAFLSVVIGLFAQTVHAEDTIILRYNERPPFQVTLPDGSLGGRLGAPTLRAFRDAGISVETRVTPAKRQTALLVANQEMSCMLGWAVTPERLVQGKFSAVIYQAQRLVGVARADAAGLQDGMPLSGALQNRDLRLLLKEGYRYSTAIGAALEQYRPPLLHTTGEAETMLRMLLLGRADYTLMSQEEAEYVIAHEKLPRRELKYVLFSDLGAPFDRRVWCTHSVPDALMVRLDAAIRRNVARYPQSFRLQ